MTHELTLELAGNVAIVTFVRTKRQHHSSAFKLGE